MDEVEKRLHEITDVWNSYFLNYKYCQSKIKFNTEVESNYYGNILHYLLDTLSFFSKIKLHENFNESVFQSITLMQIVFVQQDLIDEILYIFKLQESLSADKNPNREIRNELVGHPIRRQKKGSELISSVLFGRHFVNDTIHYIKYSKSNGYSGESINYSLNDIITRHNEYLNKYLDIVWKKCRDVLTDYRKQLISLQSISRTNVDFNQLLDYTEQIFETLFDDNYLFKKQYIKECFARADDHARYKHAVDLFTNTLNEYLIEQIKEIGDLCSVQDQIIEYDSLSVVKNVNSNLGVISEPNYIPNLRYEFSKLHEKHPIWGIIYFKRLFHNNEIIAIELNNMENNMENELEYFSSYEYLRILLIQQGYLKS